MRTPIIAGNWKMFKTLTESVAFARELAPRLAAYSNVEIVVCPTFVSLAGVADALGETEFRTGTPIKVGAQNVHWEENGAYTSQISPTMLQGLAEYVIIGHSECRQYLHETNADINRKAKAALAHGLKPIIAVGESLETNEAGQTQAFVSEQVRAALDGIAAVEMERVVIAYEPIWAIGTGRSASGLIAQEVIGGTIRGELRNLYGQAVASTVRIQYGGSVKPGNMAEYMGQPDVDGALVGGAALKVEDFAALIEIANNVKGAQG